MLQRKNGGWDRQDIAVANKIQTASRERCRRRERAMSTMNDITRTKSSVMQARLC
jgi:hypothetical protein